MRGTCEKYYNYKVIHDDEICLFSMTRDIKEKYGSCSNVAKASRLDERGRYNF